MSSPGEEPEVPTWCKIPTSVVPSIPEPGDALLFTLVLLSQSLWARCHPHSSALLQEPVGDVRKKAGSKTVS